MATAKKDTTTTNGKRWKKVERSRLRYWKPDDDSTSITGRLGARQEKVGRYGLQGLYTLETTEAGSDRKGDYPAGSVMAIAETAVLRELNAHIGREIRISPAGLDGRVRLFDIEVAE